MHPVKYLWGIRALLYYPFLGRIGFPSYIGKPCFVEGAKNIFIDKNVRIFPGLRIQTMNNGVIKIGCNTAIEQNVHITCSSIELNIGKDVTVLGNTFITNIDHLYQDINLSTLNQGISVKETSIGDGCFIGFGVAIQAGTKLGKHCVVGTNSVVRGEYPDYSVIVGNPARVVKRYNHQSGEWERV